jgi:hypothetical protein
MITASLRAQTVRIAARPVKALYHTTELIEHICTESADAVDTQIDRIDRTVRCGCHDSTGNCDSTNCSKIEGCPMQQAQTVQMVHRVVCLSIPASLRAQTVRIAHLPKVLVSLVRTPFHPHLPWSCTPTPPLI